MKIPDMIESKKHRQHNDKHGTRYRNRKLDLYRENDKIDYRMQVDMPAKSRRRKGLQLGYLQRRLAAIKRLKFQAEREILEHTSLKDLI